MSGLIVTVEHLRTVRGFNVRPGFCLSKSRVWFSRNGLDFRDFLRNGIPAETLEATGDGFALAVVAHARAVEAVRGK